MSIATKLDFAQYPNITALSQQDLENHYRKSHPWRLWLPSPLSQLKNYLSDVQPENVMVDEAPMETNLWRKTLTLHNSIIANLAPYFGNWVVVFYLLMLILPPFSLFFLSILLQPSWCPWMALITFLAPIWVLLGLAILPHDIAKTRTMLESLPKLNSFNSSCFWMAIHSFLINDVSFGFGTSKLSAEQIKEFSISLAGTYSSPTLRHNLRNTHAIGKIGITSNVKWVNIAPNVPKAAPPRVPPTLQAAESSRPLYIPVHSISQLDAALKRAHAHLEKPKTIVVLLDEERLVKPIETALACLPLCVVTFTKPAESQNCEAFLKNPEGALITTSLLFSGMEAETVIWVRGAKNEMERSNRQRAIHKLCVIDTNANYCRRARLDFRVDGTFAKCHLPWPANMHECWMYKISKCLSCNHENCPRKPRMLICSHCKVVCHDYEKVRIPPDLPPLSSTCSNPTYISDSDLSTNEMYRNIWHWFVPNNSCFCQTMGQCKLQRSEWEVKLLPWLGLISTTAFFIYSILIFPSTFDVVPISSSFMCVCLTILIVIITVIPSVF